MPALFTLHPEVPVLLRASKDAPVVRARRGSQGLAPQGEGN